MLFGKRLFPYPVLNADKSLNQFPKCSFSGVFESETNGEYLVFKGAHYVLNNNYIKNLIKKDKAECVLYVECPSTRFRKIFALDSSPQDIKIPLYQLNGQIQICSYIYAKDNIKPYSPEGVDESYGGFTDFEVEKYDVLAIDECERFRISFDVNDENLTSSIFLVVLDPNIVGDKIDVLPTERKIKINVSPDVHSWYTAIKGSRDYKWLPFSILLTQGLMQVFEQIKTDNKYKSLADIEHDYQWFMSVEDRFEKAFGRKLTFEEFCGEPSFEMAQELLDTPCGKAMRCSFDLIIGGSNNDD